MCVHVKINMYIFIQIYVHIHLYMYLYIRVHTHTHSYTHTYVLYIHIFIFILHTHIHIYVSILCVYIEGEKGGSQATIHLNLLLAILLTVTSCLPSPFSLPPNTSCLFLLSRLKQLSVMTLSAVLE